MAGVLVWGHDGVGHRNDGRARAKSTARCGRSSSWSRIAQSVDAAGSVEREAAWPIPSLADHVLGYAAMADVQLDRIGEPSRDGKVWAATDGERRSHPHPSGDVVEIVGHEALLEFSRCKR